MGIRSLMAKFKDILVIDREVSVDLEASKILASNESVPVLFESLNGQRAIGNLWSTRERICRALGVDARTLMENMSKAMSCPSDPKMVDEAPFKESRTEDINLGDLAIPKYYPVDGGRYLTSGVVIGEFEGVRNLSFHRMKMIGKNRLAIRLVPRDLFEMHRKAVESGKDLQIAIAIGLCPSILLPAAMTVGYGNDELRIANSLRELCLEEPVHVAKAGNGISVPAYSEIVLEGRITSEMVDEGPFVDITTTVDYVRKQPVVEIDAMSTRSEPIMQLLLSGGAEHRILMGMPREPVIYSGVGKVVPGVENVYLTEGSCGWLHGVVSIAKVDDEDGKKAGLAALDAHKSMKSVVVVDRDIDIYDPSDVEWAIATRFQPQRDLTILENCRGSSLDPSAGETTGKMVIDATIKGSDLTPFTRAKL